VQIAHAVIDYGNPLGHDLQHPFGRGTNTPQVSISRYGHTQRSAKGFKYRFCLVMSVVATKVIDMQGDLGMIHKPLKKLHDQINIEIANFCSGKRHVKLQTWPATTIDHYTR
jgi:hypothetical protein